MFQLNWLWLKWSFVMHFAHMKSPRDCLWWNFGSVTWSVAALKLVRCCDWLKEFLHMLFSGSHALGMILYAEPSSGCVWPLWCEDDFLTSRLLQRFVVHLKFILVVWFIPFERGSSSLNIIPWIFCLSIIRDVTFFLFSYDKTSTKVDIFVKS